MVEIRALSPDEAQHSELGQKVLAALKDIHGVLVGKEIPPDVAINALGLLLGELLGHCANSQDSFEQMFIALACQISSTGNQVFERVSTDRAANKKLN